MSLEKGGNGDSQETQQQGEQCDMRYCELQKYKHVGWRHL